MCVYIYTFVFRSVQGQWTWLLEVIRVDQFVYLVAGVDLLGLSLHLVLCPVLEFGPWNQVWTTSYQ